MTTPYALRILADTPRAYYRLDESSGVTAHDSANHYDAMLAGTFTLSQSGAIASDTDTAISFGVSGTLALPSALNTTSWSAISVEFWINLAGTWQYTVITSDDSITVSYINGLVASAVATSTIEAGSLLDFFGSYNAGVLDEVAIYDYVLSPVQIRGHYQTSFSGSFFYGAGTFSAAAPARKVALTVTMAGSGVLSLKKTAILAGKGSLTATITVKTKLAATLHGTGTFTESHAIHANLSATFTGVGTIRNIGTYEFLILADAPKAYYRLNETSGATAHDISGYHNNAALSGAFTFAHAGLVPGDSDTATSFGTSGTLSLPRSLGYATWSAISIEYWIDIGQGAQFVAVTSNNNVTTTYINGSVSSTTTGSPIEVGSLFDFFGSYDAGTLDEVVIYDYVLSSSQIGRHWGGVFISSVPILGNLTTSIPLPQMYRNSVILGSSITFSNTGNSPLIWSASVTSGWSGITLGNTSGSIRAGGTGSIPIIATSGSGDSGNYTAVVTLVTNGGTQTITIIAFVVDSTAKLLRAVQGTIITAAIFNQVINALQRSPGSQELGHYYCGGNAYTVGCNVSLYVKSISRTSVPVSVSIDQSDEGYTHATGLSTNYLTQGGFHVFITSTTSAAQVSTGGKYTLQF